MNITQQKQPVDCRKCVHGYDIREGVSVTCAIRARSSGTTPVPWDDVAGGVCSDWRERAASPPVSADREGPDLLDAARLVLYALGRQFGCCLLCLNNDSTLLHQILPGGLGTPAENCPICALRRAISSEEARRARPAIEDPMDAELRAAEIRADTLELDRDQWKNTAEYAIRQRNDARARVVELEATVASTEKERDALRAEMEAAHQDDAAPASDDGRSRCGAHIPCSSEDPDACRKRVESHCQTTEETSHNKETP